MRWINKAAPAERRTELSPLSPLSPYQQALRDRLLAVPVLSAPEPWRPVFESCAAVGGLTGIGFAAHPEHGHDLVMVVSHNGHGLFDAVTGERIARDPDTDTHTHTHTHTEDSSPDTAPDLSCPGLGPLAGRRVRIAGLFGGELHSTAGDGWSVDVVAPGWPHERVLLSRGSGLPHPGPHGERWWHIFHADYSELRAVGFSPSGQTLAVATSSDLTLWTRSTPA